MMSIRTQLGVVFVMVLLPIVVTAGAIVAVSRMVVVETREIFDDSLRFEEIDRMLLEADQHLRSYLDVRNLESLQSYYEVIDGLQRNAAELPSVPQRDEPAVSLFLVHRLINRYISSTAEVVAAGRGRLVTEYTQRYRTSVRIRELTSLLVSTLYWQDVGSNLERFTLVSGTLNQLVIESAVALVVIAVLAVICIGLLSRQIADPITQLSTRTHQVADGAFDLPDFGDQKVAREIADLGHSFDVMKRSIQLNIEQINRNADVERRLMEQDIAVLRMRSSLRTAQLNALQSRINPHFLYNTLNTGVQLSVVEGANRTTEYLERFATAVRGLLADPATPVTVKAEFESLEHYLYIMRIRFGERIRFVTHVDRNIWNLRVPPLILQPLVENCITHGLRNREEGGLVAAEGRLELHQGRPLLVLQVSDNGIGMSPENSKAILTGEHPISDPSSESDSRLDGERGIGMHNVVERLRIFFGVHDICEIESAPESGTVVRFLLPAPDTSQHDAGEREELSVD